MTIGLIAVTALAAATVMGGWYVFVIVGWWPWRLPEDDE